MRFAFPDRHVVARDCNVLRVDFRRDPEPPAPHFPGAGALRDFMPSERVEAVSRSLCEARVA